MLARVAAVSTLVLSLVACGGSSEDTGSTHHTGGSGGKSGSGGTSASGGTGGSGGNLGGASGSSSGGSAGAPGCGLPPATTGQSKLALTSSGVDRTANLYVPASYDASKAVPLIMVFHGWLGTAEQMEDITSLDALADQNGFVLAYGQGLDQSWNAGKCCGNSATLQRPDVQFVSDLIDTVSAKICVDPKRVYATGFSNGGMLSSRLGCELGNRIAAIGPVAGPIAIDGCSPSRPIPVIEFHGTGDIVVPYYGNGLGGALSVPDAINIWKTNAQCTDATPATVYQQGDATCTEYQACATGTAVRLCTIDQGGHQWPGGKPAGIGKVSTDINASAEIVKFFLAHAMM